MCIYMFLVLCSTVYKLMCNLAQKPHQPSHGTYDTRLTLHVFTMYSLLAPVDSLAARPPAAPAASRLAAPPPHQAVRPAAARPPRLVLSCIKASRSGLCVFLQCIQSRLCSKWRLRPNARRQNNNNVNFHNLYSFWSTSCFR